MARLPVPGGDAGDWGRILNEYLRVEHNADGSLKNVARPIDLDSKANKVELGSAAAADTKAFATSAQGSKADTAVQPSALADYETTEQLIARDSANRDRSNHTGTQTASTISDFDSAVSGNSIIKSLTPTEPGALIAADADGLPSVWKPYQIDAARYPTLQAAYDDLPSEGGVILLRGGRYDVGDGLQLDRSKKAQFIGAGFWSMELPGGGSLDPYSGNDAVLYSSTGAEALVTWADTWFSNGRGFNFTNLVFDMTDSATKYAIAGPSISFGSVERCRFRFGPASPDDAAAIHLYIDSARGDDISWWRIRDNLVKNGALAFIGDGLAHNQNNQQVIEGNIGFGGGPSRTGALPFITLNTSHRSVVRDNNVEGYATGIRFRRCWSCLESGNGGESTRIFIDLINTSGSNFSPIGISNPNAIDAKMFRIEASYDNIIQIPSATGQADLYGSVENAITFISPMGEGDNTILAGRDGSYGSHRVRGTAHTRHTLEVKNTGAGAMGPNFSVLRVSNVNESDTGYVLRVDAGGGAEAALFNGHIAVDGGLPLVNAAEGAGASATITNTGNDSCGNISITTGDQPTGGSVVVSVTFSTTYAKTPKVILLTPTNSNSAQLHGDSAVYVDEATITSRAFEIRVGSTQLAADISYSWSYLVIG